MRPRTVTAPAGTANVTVVGTAPGNPVLQAVSGSSRSGPLTLAIQTAVSTIAPAPAVDLANHPDAALTAAVARSRDILSQIGLPAGIAAQLAALKAPVEVPSLVVTAPGGGSIAGISPGVLAGITGGQPDATASAPGPLTVASVDSGPANSGTGVPLTITETVAPQGFQLDTRPQSITVGFDSCLDPAPTAGSPAWTVTTATVGSGRVQTVTLRDAAAAVVTPPVVTTPPVVPPVVTTPPVIPPVVTTPPVIPPVVTTPPVIPPVVTTPPVVPPVVTTPPVVTPPVVTPPVVTPAPAPTGVAIAVPVTPAPQVARVAPPRGVDAGLAPAADTSASSSTGQRVLGGILALAGLTAAGGLLARRRRH